MDQFSIFFNIIKKDVCKIIIMTCNRTKHLILCLLKETKYKKSKYFRLALHRYNEIYSKKVNFGRYHCQVKNKSVWSISLSLLTCWKDHVESHVNLFSYIIITVTKWNCLKSKLRERKQKKQTLKYTQLDTMKSTSKKLLEVKENIQLVIFKNQVPSNQSLYLLYILIFCSIQWQVQY